MEKYYLDSVDYYAAAMKKSDSAVLHNKAGIAFMLLARSKDAKKEFEYALRLNPNYAEAHNNLGALFYEMRRYGNAIKEYRRAIALNEENPSFHVNLGSAYFSKDDVRAAMREYGRARELDPEVLEHHGSSGAASLRLVSAQDLARFHYMLAQVFAGQGDVANCRHYLSKASEEGYPFVHNALKDDQFSALRKDPEFIVFVRGLKPTPPPPATER
ncbi:MAG TPA: tetratricopeptide repeat protein [Alphaproteobacteria bacterium]|nr:tetratricopeptide repeat protein [Alphaproteobacteria bacterium]